MIKGFSRFGSFKRKENLSVEERIGLVKRNTYEIIGEKELGELLEKKKKPVAYIGTAPTGRPHVGYFMWGLKVADLLKAGFKVKILIADLHAALDNTLWYVLDKRYDYYSKIIPLMIKSMGADTSNLEFIKGSEFQLKPEYMFDVLRMSSFVSMHDANKAASEVVKLGKNPKVSGLLYPLMQAMDEQYLNADLQIGGGDQRKIMVLAREQLPKLGYASRVELMVPIIPGLIGEKMSASDEKSKVDLLDDEETVLKKIKGAEFSTESANNGLMAFLKYVIMTIKQDKKEIFFVRRNEKHGGDLEYNDYESIEKDFLSKKLHPLDLKNSVAEYLSHMLEPINKHRKELEALSEKAYKNE